MFYGPFFGMEVPFDIFLASVLANLLLLLVIAAQHFHIVSLTSCLKKVLKVLKIDEN